MNLKLSTQDYKRHTVVTFGIPTVVTVKVLGFWDLTPCILVRVKVRARVNVKVNLSPVTCYE
jgi:hypothetical protein